MFSYNSKNAKKTQQQPTIWTIYTSGYLLGPLIILSAHMVEDCHERLLVLLVHMIWMLFKRQVSRCGMPHTHHTQSPRIEERIPQLTDPIPETWLDQELSGPTNGLVTDFCLTVSGLRDRRGLERVVPRGCSFLPPLLPGCHEVSRRHWRTFSMFWNAFVIISSSSYTHWLPSFRFSVYFTISSVFTILSQVGIYV